MTTKSPSACYLCGCAEYTQRPGSVRDNKKIGILECARCGLVFLSSFDHIHDSFYQDAGMHAAAVDRATWQRETANDDERRLQALRGVIENRSVLDFGCGNGGFLTRARKLAEAVAGVELEETHKEWFREEGLQVYTYLEEVDRRFDVITLFHVLEHLDDPRAMLEKLAQRLEGGGQLIVEVPSSSDCLLSLFDCKPFQHFTYWSCHLYLFNQTNLATLAEQAGLRVNYIKQVQRYPLSNHLYWLSAGKPGGHQRLSFQDSAELHAAYEKQLASIATCDTIMASFSK